MTLPIALQLYSVRADCARDMAGTIRAAAEMGYVGVEFAGWNGHSAKDLRAMLDDNNLRCAGAHVGLDTMLGDDLEKSIEFHRTLGNEFLIVPGLPAPRRETREKLLETAHLFNEVAQKLAPHGMKTGYHSHHFDFEYFGDELAWDVLFGNTQSDVVMQFDTGNALSAGFPAPPFLERYPNRATTVHLKEHSDTNPGAFIGEGDVPWPTIFELCETLGGTQWYIVEHETYPIAPLDCARRELENLKKMGK